MSKIKWLSEALVDVERLHAFLKDINPDAAVRAATAILEGVTLLGAYPYLGRPMLDGTGRRELFISFAAGAYVLRYMLEDGDTIVIVRVWHSREKRERG